MAIAAFVILALAPEVSPTSQRAPRPFPRKTPTPYYPRRKCPESMDLGLRLLAL